MMMGKKNGPPGPCEHVRCISRIASPLVALALISVCMSPNSAASACDPPVNAGLLHKHGNGESLPLKWDAPHGGRRFRVWAQWRVPEGEVLSTYETVVDACDMQLPPSPARWRPLKLSIELQSICELGAVSTITRMHQLQFDAQAEAACPPAENVRIEHAHGRLVWEGGIHDRFELSFHKGVDGVLIARQEVVGTSLDWPAPVHRPAIIRVVRACGEAQRSRATFLLMK